MAVIEQSTDLFRWTLRSVAAADDRKFDAVAYDAWLDYQIWRNRKVFSGGLCHFWGRWPEKSIWFASAFSKSSKLKSLSSLTAIPLAYSVYIDPQNQSSFLRDFLIPYAFHYRNSRSAPPIYMVGKFDGRHLPEDHRFLSISADEKIPSGVRIALGSRTPGCFRLGHCAVARSLSSDDESLQQIMFSATIYFSSIF